MLKIRLVNNQVTLNNFKTFDAIEYVPNIPLTIKFQISDAETKIRFMANASAKMNIIFQKTDGGTLVKVASKLFNPNDLSLWTVSLTASESNSIVGSNFQVVLDNAGDSTLADLSDSSQLDAGQAYGVLSKQVLEGDC
jgi:hypothetical protein